MPSILDILEAFQGEPYKIGARVTLTEYYETDDRPYYLGHEFTIEYISGRLFGLIDEVGNRLQVLDKHIE